MNQGYDSKQPCFIDSNIWLYVFMQRQDSKKAAIAKSIIRQNNLVISTQVINEVCANILKKTSLSETELQELISTFYKKYIVIDINQEILLKSSELRKQYNFSFWDSLIVACALHIDLKRLYSEDMQNGLVVEKTLKIINPFTSEAM